MRGHCYILLVWFIEQNPEQKNLKNFYLPRKEACINLDPWKEWLLKWLAPLKRSQALVLRTIGKAPGRHPRNWSDYIHSKLRVQNCKLILKSVEKISQAPVAHFCNPSYLGGWNWEDHCSRSAQANSLWCSISTTTRAKWTGDVPQGILLYMHKSLSSNTSTTEEREKDRRYSCPGIPSYRGLPKEMFSQVQLPSHPKTTAEMVQGGKSYRTIRRIRRPGSCG
jgi:hypothetical protein